MEFEIFRSRHNPEHYVAIDAASREHNAVEVRQSQNLTRHARIRDDGTVHLGFDIALAKAAIHEHGFYAFALSVTPRDGID